eukprot:snap_masked-scaffold356_size197960-processed-gene-0.11 protein:Tk00528 transcript:snap_masked-scaffold356_size197960-processed-gene-0.11-mRNA-1 annotation:"nucleolysin tiar"
MENEEDNQVKTLYVGNLDQSVTEELILALFGSIGPVKGCKIIREPTGHDPYCFVEFTNHAAALAALTAMNRRTCLNRELKVNWASSQGGGHALGGPPGAGPGPAGGVATRVDTSNHHHIFVGDLSPEVETEALRTAFQPFGEISDCKVVKDMATNWSKGYGFVSFVRKVDALTAMEQMNGQWLGSRAIRTNWATRKPPPPTGKHAPENERAPKSLNYDDVFNQASDVNCTVYCGGLAHGDDTIIRRSFSPFGRIMEVRYFKDKGYAFVRFDNKESACNAIVAMHGQEVAGQSVKCSWGKEGGGNHGGGGGGGYFDPSGGGGGGGGNYPPMGGPDQFNYQYYPQAGAPYGGAGGFGQTAPYMAPHPMAANHHQQPSPYYPPPQATGGYPYGGGQYGGPPPAQM